MAAATTEAPVVARRRALAVVCGILALTFLDTTVVSVALGSIQTSLHLGVAGLQWVVDAYALAFASLMLTGGTLGDRFGRRRVMLWGVGIFCAASLVGALAGSRNLLLAMRAVMGVGAAASEPGTLSVLRHVFPDERGRVKALSLWAAVSSVGLALGPLLGGVLVGLWGWRAIFWFNVVAGGLLLLSAHRYVPESADPEGARVDVPGQILGVAAIGTVVFGLIRGQQDGYASPAIVAMFVLGAAFGVAFVIRELHTAMPMLDLRYFRRLRFTAALTVAFAVYFGTFSIFFFTALYLEQVVKYSGYRTAALFLPMTALMVGGAVLAGRLVVRRGGRWTMAAGSLVAAIGIIATEPLVTRHPSFVALSLTLAVTGAGVGAAMVPVTSVVLEVVPPEHSGMAASATNTARQLGVVFGVAILGSLVNGRLTTNLTRRLTEMGIPSGIQGAIIKAYEHGTTPSGGEIAGARQTFGTIVDRIVSAAYAAYHVGLSSALVISATLIAASSLFAGYAAVRRDHSEGTPTT